MDERVFKIKTGVPIPVWDSKHRLSIGNYVGPECKDSGTVFRINSVYMDVSDQPHIMRQWLAGGILVAIIFAMLFFSFLIFVIFVSPPPIWDGKYYFFAIQLAAFSAGFSYFALRFGRDEMFSLTRRPIRFNRVEKKIYVIRRRRFFSSAKDGDVTWEVPWNENTIFCIHSGRKNSNDEDTYHIRCYETDSQGNVLRGFAIGREWDELDGMNDLLCQWNYWCWYMNSGPSELPRPLLFLSEKEGLFESFLYCMYEVGFGLSPMLRIVLLPFFFWMTIQRVLALSTCRPPIWPENVEKVSLIAEDDPFQQPTGDTPIGWAQTSQAHRANSYPADPRRKIPNWSGAEDGLKNAERWQAEVAPGN
ncbi:DUF6708 domain-containing protein [Duganella caerulea]|uniref:DUF6708 domain-containing protein n=1 Tax=Duganella caerulea TaxID=2885762 RepID=UPI0040384076